MIASLEETRRQSEDDAERSHALLVESETLRKELQDKLQAYEERKEALDKKAKEKARKIVDEAKKEAESIIAELREMRKNADQVVKEHELIEARKRLEEATPLDNNKVLKKAAQVKARAQNLVVGDEVKVLSYGQRGTLLEKVSNSEWVVQMGILKMKISDSDLEYIKPEKEPVLRTAGVKNRNSHVKLELDLRGERYEDAILRTEKYIDDALLSNYGRVSIIHGVGTGALRQGIQSYLKKHKRVKSFRFGEAGEGGLGVTVVELK